jgi:hypothetical protein
MSVAHLLFGVLVVIETCLSGTYARDGVVHFLAIVSNRTETVVESLLGVGQAILFPLGSVNTRADQQDENSTLHNVFSAEGF